MAYRRRRRSTSRRLLRSSRGRRSFQSRAGYGRYRPRRARRGREMRLVIQAPRGLMPRIVKAGQGVRYRRRRAF